MSLLLVFNEPGSLGYMAHLVQLMPARCSRCGELFDLSYELGEDTFPEERIIRLSGPVTRTKLCWSCRV